MAEQEEIEGTGNDIAIIGMAGRFPGAGDVHAFWRNLRDGVESISHFQAEELESSPLVPEALRAHPDFVRAGGVLEGADLFDNGFFDISPREALWMDPQQRVFLECAWAALEDAAYDPERFPGKISLYAGAGQSGHVLSLLGHVKKEPAALFEALGTTTAENVATKASFKLRLRGESLALYTACSTGLVAVHMACQSLLLRQSDIALAGAVRVSLPQRTGYLYQEGMIFSPDGHCRAFDARARGTVSGNGVGVVVLKPLADALRDGDHVYAVIKGSAINNDGHQKVGYTAPSVEGQAEAISEALAYAGVGAGDLGYVEAHGTGTSLGDPIEVSALTRAFRRDTDARGFCALGSVKTNIGHLDTAAGLAGLLKATLALYHEEIPPSLHFERPNPAIDFAGSPFFVASERREWARGERPRLAGVSSFGIGGTNAHAILAEAPLRASRPSLRPRQLVTLSARTASALEAMTQELAAHLEAHPGVDLADLAFTRAVGRKAFEHRRALVARDAAGLLARLKAPPASRSLASLEAAREQRVAFLFPGQGAQSVGMARELYAAEPVFREHVDACLALIAPRLGRDLRPVLYPEPGQEAAAREALAEPRYALPALFTVEYALARLWMDWGFEPHAMLGHSYGEYVAACLAGVLPLEDALALAVARGQLMARMPPGAMTAVGCSEAELQPLLTGALSLAAINGAGRCVVSGPVEEVERLEQELVRQGVGVLRLPARQAFHSTAVEPLREELERIVAGLRLSAPQRPYVSSLTGTWIRAEEATDPSYWARQMRQPVRFAAGLDTLQQEGCGVYLEVGPDQALTTLARMHPRGEGAVRVVPSLPRAGSSVSEHGVLLEALGELWQAGLEVRWERFFAHEQRGRLPLPTYPFERQLFRLEPRWMETEVAPAPVQAPAPVKVPVSASLKAPASKEAPRTDVEREVMVIWRERLGLEDIGIHDNFLELGGNSLMAAQMLTRLRESFPVQLPLSDLFEAPTVAGIAGRIEARLKEAGTSESGVPVPHLVPIAREGVLPLSFVQERVCALERFVPGNPALNMPMVLRLTGTLEVAVLERSLAEIVRRHEALRITYAAVDGRFVPRVLSELKPSIPIITLEGSRDEREAEALRLAREEAARPFSLERGPVLRASLVRIAPDTHLLLVTVHHVVSDTLSMVAIARELAVNYEAFLQGRPSPLPPLPVQYVDFAAWQRRALESGAFSAQQAWWRERMAAPPGALALPTDRPRGATPGLIGARRLFGLSRRLSDAIQALGQREGFTSFMILLSGFKALLARYAGQEDIVVGTPIGNRTRGELEPLVGYVAHSVPLRTDLSGDPTFRELLGRVRDTTLGAYANPDVPYEHLVRELEPAKDPDSSRLFDALFVLHAGFASHLKLPGLRMEHVEVPDAPSQFGSLLANFCISLGEGEQGFAGSMEYATELFEPATIDRMIGHFEALLESAVKDPGLCLSELSLMTEAERSQWVALAAPAPEPTRARFLPVGQGTPRRPLAFGLSYFANDEDGLGRRKYQLLLDGARFADAHGFSAIWTPERHFHSFGGLYPSPAITGAGIATLTENIGIRAGSVVLPLHDPLQVAEEWAMIDNLSDGRVGVSFASGWHANDFVFAPDHYARRRELMLRGIETVRHLWRGGAVCRRNGEGKEVEVSIRPRPVQAELPFWLTAAGNPDTFRLAGELGANVLTNLMGQEMDALAEKVALYREAWRRHGHAGRGQVSLMLHAFLGTEVSKVRRTVREPLLRYFRGSVDIFNGFAASQGLKLDTRTLTPRDMDALLEHGFERYLEDGGLFGTPESCASMVERLRRLDIDEVACLVDFGTDTEATLESLQHLDTLRRRSQLEASVSAPSVLHESGARAEVVRHEETLGPGTWLPVRPDEVSGNRILSPPSHARFHVLDSRGQPVPVGVVGALAIEGGDVPRGFWMAPEATRNRLVPHPSEAGARLFLTGQRARCRADGSVELLSVEAPRARRPAPAQAPTPRPEVVRPPEGPPAITRMPRDGALPLSFAQQRLWYLDQLEPGNVAYNNPFALRLSGRLDVAALERVLNEVVRRHEVLRTTFILEDSGPVQRIAPSLFVPLVVVTRLEVSEERDAEIARWLREESQRPFALATGPLIRAALLCVHDTEHVLLVNPHHIVTDGWSAGVMMAELAGLYGAFVSGAGSPLPELPVQYADYAAWQHQWLRGPALEAELSWWREALAEVPVLRLPMDRPRPAVQTYQGAQHRFTVPKPLAEALGALARREGATTFMLLMAAWQVLLSRYSGQEDFAVGTAVAGRNRPEIEPLVGCFVNSLPLRADLSGDPTFLELLGRVRRMALGAFAHQEAPFEKLVDALHVTRDASHSPIFQTMLVLHNISMPTVRLADLTLSGMELHTGSAKMDLCLELRETAEGLRAGLEYNTDLFDPETASQLASHFVLLLEGMLSAPERRLSALPWVSEAERRMLLVEWNPPRGGVSSDSLTALFAAQVARTPEALAVVDDTEALTFRELEGRAHRIAHLLRRYGVGAESVVALALERPLDAVAAMLGTLSAGGAWLSLDFSHPQERLRLMLDDAGARVVLTREPLRGAFLEKGARVVACLEEAASEPATSPGIQPAPHHAAYVLFTSGSTGRPKGVVVEHRHLACATRARVEAYGPPGRCVTLSPFTFDASYRDLFWALFHGGTLHYGAEQGWEDPRVLAATIARHRIEYLFGVPSPYARLLEAAPAGSLGSLRSVFIGGEVCPRELVRAHQEAAPSASFFNEYGPTEVSIWCTLHRVNPAESGSVPIGRPIAGYRAYILDEHLQPVPPGVPGELYVGGAGVARGYIGRPELTAERFGVDPFDATPGARMYRTGDRCRWRRDGEIEFLGRWDGQVKVRGFRVETGEIESVLATHPGIRESVVLAREDERGVMRLIGYVVPHQRPGPGPDVLRDFLRERLPEYMVPFAFVELESLPRARSGKVNLGALPLPERQTSARREAYVAPRTELEERLARLWSEVLGVERVGVDDNFFELGGDSILSIQIVTRAGRAGIELSPRQVFQNPTVARLAAVANTRLAVRAEQGPVTGAVALMPIQRWFFAQALAEPHHWNMSLFLEVRAALDAEVLERALGHVVEHHDALRLHFARGEEGWRQVCAAPGEPVRLERVSLSGLPVEAQAVELERRATEAQGLLRLEEGPLLRAVLFDLGAGRTGRLLLVLHHLVMDGISWRILLEDLLGAYQQLVAGAPASLPPKTTSLQAWARGLSEHARSEKLDAERSWWLERPWSRVTRLPVDVPGGENTEDSARSVSLGLTAEETQALLRDVPRAYHTRINDALLTALARTLGHWTGNPLVLVDVESHGREELLAGLDVSRTVGWLTTYFPALLDLREAGGPGEALRAVKEQLRAVPSKGMGYGLLRYLREDTGLAGLPAAELSFNYLGQVDEALAGNGMLALAPEGMGPQRGLRNRRPYLLELVGAVVDGRLRMTWMYGESLHHRASIERLAADFLVRLRELIAHCQSPEAGGHTPSDFPLAKVKQTQLDKLSARFGKKTR
jgi:natural product biosynthesis luciferase-like monooxygenase protein/amino acid adenylation domain-containing protein/non-ribosomal peptide synthase protein (TIGR01720 family)